MAGRYVLFAHGVRFLRITNNFDMALRFSNMNHWYMTRSSPTTEVHSHQSKAFFDLTSHDNNDGMQDRRSITYAGDLLLRVF